MRIVATALCLLSFGAAAEPYRSVPDPALTPGVARSDLTVQQICSTKWGKDARAVSEAMKNGVLAAYGVKQRLWLIPDPAHPDKPKRQYEYEIDHLVSRENGGADDVRNLWAQCYFGQWGAHAKDRLENELHRRLCAGQATLQDVQGALSGDWRRAYVAAFGQPSSAFPAPQRACSADDGT